MARRLFAASLAALCIVAGLAAALALRAPTHNVMLNATRIRTTATSCEATRVCP